MLLRGMGDWTASRRTSSSGAWKVFYLKVAGVDVEDLSPSILRSSKETFTARRMADMRMRLPTCTLLAMLLLLYLDCMTER